MVKTRTRRSPEQMIEDLQQEIERIKTRAAQRKVRRDPALQHVTGAVRSIDKAMGATTDAATRKALNEARATLAACLSLNGAAPRKGPRRGAARVDPAAVVAFLKNHPWCSSAQVGEAVGSDVATLRPVLKRLIADGAVKVSGKARGTRYARV
jgi:hypothetical protein